MPEFFDITTYDYNKVNNILDIPETYIEIASLSTPVREAGVYEIGYSLTASFDQSNSSIYIRFSIDDGGTWSELVYEPSDASNVIAEAYPFPKEQDEGAFNMKFEARKESALGVFNIAFLDLWYKRVGDLP